MWHAGERGPDLVSCTPVSLGPTCIRIPIVLDKAQRLRAAGDHKQAARVLRAMLLSGAPPHDRAEVYALLAEISIDDGDYRKAYSMVRRCLELKPEHASARALLRDHRLDNRNGAPATFKYVVAVVAAALILAAVAASLR